MSGHETPSQKKKHRGEILVILAFLWLIGTCVNGNEKPKTGADFYEEYLRIHPDVWNDMRRNLTR